MTICYIDPEASRAKQIEQPMLEVISWQEITVLTCLTYSRRSGIADSIATPQLPIMMPGPSPLFEFEFHARYPWIRTSLICKEHRMYYHYVRLDARRILG